MGTGHTAWYSRTLNNLESRTKTLLTSVRRSSRREAAERLQREYDSCHGFLENMKEYASQHRISDVRYTRKLAAIDSHLELAKQELQRKVQPWWKPVLKVVSRALSLLSMICGLFGIDVPTFWERLTSGPKLLSSG